LPGNAVVLHIPHARRASIAPNGKMCIMSTIPFDQIPYSVLVGLLPFCGDETVPWPDLATIHAAIAAGLLHGTALDPAISKHRGHWIARTCLTYYGVLAIKWMTEPRGTGSQQRAGRKQRRRVPSPQRTPASSKAGTRVIQREKRAEARDRWLYGQAKKKKPRTWKALMAHLNTSAGGGNSLRPRASNRPLAAASGATVLIRYRLASSLTSTRIQHATHVELS
jgi:hypothetical protein